MKPSPVFNTDVFRIKIIQSWCIHTFPFTRFYTIVPSFTILDQQISFKELLYYDFTVFLFHSLLSPTSFRDFALSGSRVRFHVLSLLPFSVTPHANIVVPPETYVTSYILYIDSL